MHNCPRCEGTCSCDLDDVWCEQYPEECFHDCDEGWDDFAIDDEDADGN